MKRCLNCGSSFQASSWTCVNCGHAPAILDGFAAFAPESSIANDGFEERFFEKLFDLEVANFWFKARSALVRWILKEHFPSMKTYLEIGCGTGYMLSETEQAFPSIELSGSEIYSRGLAHTRRRVHRAQLFQMDARQIPFEREFDVVGAYDVIEHIAEDETVLGEMYRAVRPGGGIVITVPQHMFLWSYADEYSHHKRRYSSEELRAKVESAGFTVLRVTSFVSALLPLLYLSRLRNRRSDYDNATELRMNPIVNAFLGGVMGLERLLIKSGISLPAGGSLLLVAMRPGTE